MSKVEPSGKRAKTGGRSKGTPNKATADVKALAQQYTAGAIAELARLATKAESEAARVAAIRELLDRGHGKARQPIDADIDLNAAVTVKGALSWQPPQ